jgi:hypothetical protein
MLEGLRRVEMNEPKVVKATLRDAVDENGADEIHVECWFEDGQKYAPIIIDGFYEELAKSIAEFLNSRSKE